MYEIGEQVAIKYEAEGIQTTIMAEAFGQLALTSARHLAEDGLWHAGVEEAYDILHIKSNHLIETVECPREQALMVIDALKDFDFDTYWGLVQMGGASPAFVEAVKSVLAEFCI
jgi:hypothetical protein